MVKLENTKNRASIAEKLFNFRHTKRGLAILIGLIIVVLGVTSSIIITRLDTRKIDIAQIKKLDSTNDCKKGLSDLATVEALPRDVKGSIELLKYKSYCNMVLDRQQEAIVNLTELRNYYKQDDNKGGVRMADQQIKIAKESLTYSEPDQTSGSKPDHEVFVRDRQLVDEISREDGVL